MTDDPYPLGYSYFEGEYLPCLQVDHSKTFWFFSHMQLFLTGHITSETLMKWHKQAFLLPPSNVLCS